MTFSMAQSSLTALDTALNALSVILDKGAEFAVAKKIDPAILLQTRLAPDMFALTRQVQIATDLAKNGMARLAGVEAVRLEDKEATIEDLKARIASTTAFMKSLDAAAIDASGDREIVFPMGPINKGRMTGADYLTLYVVPNVYFHIVAAYSILRHCGVNVGKMDYLGAIPLTRV